MSVSLYTDRKVFHRLAEALPAGQPTFLDAVRWSVPGDTAGVAAQRAAHLSIYAERSAALRTVAGWPQEAWDPTRPEVGARYGIRWLALADLHHNATDLSRDPVIAVVLVGDTLLLNVTMSATRRHISRADGEDENGFLVLMLAMLNHYTSVRETRWADDPTRAARDDFGWSLLKSRLSARDVRMTLGGRVYDLKNSGDALALKVLGMTGSNDDGERRKKLTGKRLLKYMAGGAAIAEDQMPHGWRLERDRFGRLVRQGDRGLLPEGDPDSLQSLPQVYRMAAEGARWWEIGARLVGLEADGLIRRRSHSVVGRSYADTEGHGAAAAEAAKSVFVRSSFRPAVLPTEEAITRYEHGADPGEVFDGDTRLFIAKVELVRTGRYYRRLHSDLRGRGLVLNGVPAIYRDESDEFGYFDVESEPWPWPVSPDTGLPVPAFGIPDATCRAVAARLLRELRDLPVTEQGGRAHKSTSRRVLQRFECWTVPPGAPGARYDDEATEYGIEARQNASGRENFVLLFRRESDGVALRGGGRRAWSWVGPGRGRPEHTAGTGSLAELTASVRTALHDAITGLADPAALAVHRAADDLDVITGRRAALAARIDRLTEAMAAARSDAAAQRVMAGRKAAAGDFDTADRYDRLAAEKDADTARAERDLAAARADAAELDAAASEARQRQDEVNLTTAAYLVAGLDRAIAHGGRGPATVGLLADRVLREWRFLPAGDDLHWSATAALPLRSGEVLLPLSGAIRNVRTRDGRRTASSEQAARLVLTDGRDLDEVSTVLDCHRRTLLTQGVMPWLVAHGVTSRGAKNALVDHPIPTVRRIVTGAVAATPNPAAAAWPAAVTDLLLRTYTDPDLAWSDAACSDDVTPVMRLAATLSTRPDGIGVGEAALLLGLPYRTVRQWAGPYDRVSGYTRPRYLEFLPDTDGTRIRLIACPHRRCRGTASHVVLLPEVAASGYAVICRDCRRAPNPDAPWAGTAFPPVYLGHFTRDSDAAGPLRVTRQTISIPAPAGYDLSG